MNLVLAGHIRVICKYFPWDYNNMFVYRMQRLYAPALWILVGVLYLYYGNSSIKANFILYLLTGVAYQFDLYSRTTKVPNPRHRSHEEIEQERLAALQLEKEVKARESLRTASNAMLPLPKVNRKGTGQGMGPGDVQMTAMGRSAATLPGTGNGTRTPPQQLRTTASVHLDLTSPTPAAASRPSPTPVPGVLPVTSTPSANGNAPA